MSRMAAVAALTVIVTALPCDAQARGVLVTGTVTCSPKYLREFAPARMSVQGVWVQSSGGGSNFAGWKPSPADDTTARYSLTVKTKIPTRMSLHVGCGGTPDRWLSDNYTPRTQPYEDKKLKTVKLSAADCNRGACTFKRASRAAAWAEAHLSGPGAKHAVKGDKPTDDEATKWWKGLCLTFVATAVNTTLGDWPDPTVKGHTSTATGMYARYKRDGLIYKTYTRRTFNRNTGQWVTVTAKYPPRGALVFYPWPDFKWAQRAGHIGISVGNGAVISARGSIHGAGYVQEHHYTALDGYKGWAFPLNTLP